MNKKFVQKAYIGLFVAFYTVFSFVETHAVFSGFPDVELTSIFKESIFLLAERNAVEGYPDGMFRPDQLINRAEAAKIIVLAFALGSGAPTDCFSDVKSKYWFSAYICNRHFINGYPDGSFQPGAPIHLGEMFKMMYAAVYGEYIRAEEGALWFSAVLQKAAADRVLILPYAGGRLLSRAEFTEFVSRMLRLQEGTLVSDTVESERIALEEGMSFLKTQLIGEDGRIVSRGPNQAELDQDILSESVGLALNAAALAGDQALFEQLYQFLIDHMLSTHGTAFWKLDPALQPLSQSNTVIDDLQIIKGLLRGFDMFGDERYRETARTMAAALKQYGVRDNILVSAVSWDDNGVYTGTDLMLSYADFGIMKALEAFDSAWAEISARTRKIVENGYLGNGLFATRYNFVTKKYETEEAMSKHHFNMILQTYTAAHLAEAGERVLSQAQLDFLKNEFAKTQKIFGAYDRNGQKADEIEDIAVYAIAARLAYSLGDKNFAETLMQKIIALQIHDPKSPYNGVFGWGTVEPVYTFSQLNALYTLGLLSTDSFR